MKFRMLRASALAIWISIALTGAASAQSLPASLRIVILGSSTAAGIGASTQDSAWVWRYSAALKAINPGYEVLNLAKGGYTSYHLQASGFVSPDGRPDPDTARNITKALSLSPDAIILNLPSNDAASDMSVVEQIANFERILSEASADGVRVWVTTTMPRNLSEARRQNLLTVRDWISLIYGSGTVDFWSGISSESGEILPWSNSGDGVHLNDAGHALLAERILSARIPEILASTTKNGGRTTAALPSVNFVPQPTPDQVAVRVLLAPPGQFTFFMYDANGRRVQDVHRGATSNGEMYLTFPASRFDSGPYPWVLVSDGRISSGRLLMGG